MSTSIKAATNVFSPRFKTSTGGTLNSLVQEAFKWKFQPYQPIWFIVMSNVLAFVVIHKVVWIGVCEEWLVFILCLFQILGLLPVYMVYWVCIIVIGAAMWTIFSLQFFFCYLLSTYLYYINLSNTFTNHDLKQPSPSIYANKRHVVQLSE